jgi:hypothetical protein
MRAPSNSVLLKRIALAGARVAYGGSGEAVKGRTALPQMNAAETTAARSSSSFQVQQIKVTESTKMRGPLPFSSAIKFFNARAL